MEIGEIKWNKIKNKIGRWQRCETHAGQVTYELIEDADDPFVITQFVVDFEDGTVSEGLARRIIRTSRRSSAYRRRKS